MSVSTAYWCEWAWLPGGPVPGVLVETEDGRITSVSEVDGPGDAQRLGGLVLPGMANAHSHAFHRALRGRTSGGKGTFWTWRDQMYKVAARLDPESYHRLATAVFAEMALSGMTCVGEFHYLHHAPGGQRYSDPNAMGAALAQAAADAGIRLTLLDTCYLAGGFGKPVDGVQLRYSDGDVSGWAGRVDEFKPGGDHVRAGAALHSVRAVPAEAIPGVVEWAGGAGAPLHVHLSEQRAENEACLAAHGCTPTQLLASHGALGESTTAVHATHLAPGDLPLLGGSGTGVCLCPTTEADLADGIGPASALAVAGSPLSVGSDGHSVIDQFAEVQSVESYTRLSQETRGNFTPADLVTMATVSGHRALGWSDAGWIGAGARADFVAVGLDSARLAGVPPEAVVSAASADDVRDVIVDGRRVVRDGIHQSVPDLAERMRASVAALL
ncbi:formimidoylglutamate deiminase [Saccharopolyspora erythraea]|uniref:formimidoylglutamate deiminase n=1 Tax=Saccharopolyspora erythraea TaxID=1836 RepID=UPI001BAD116D|nr:formimidoylglutamate deiminase [Saccharopolyspora erythraea]QUH04807.1 formimidoylglutamate deiminase [Saccharopolyspora erythraea]